MSGVSWLIITGSGLDDWIYWHLYCNYNQLFFSMALPAHSGPRPLIQFRNHFSQTVGLLRWMISSSHGRYLHTGKHKHRINTYTHQTNALIGIRTHYPSVRASEDSSCLRPRGYWDRLQPITTVHNQWLPKVHSIHYWTTSVFSSTVMNEERRLTNELNPPTNHVTPCYNLAANRM
jgi:hypothetical protein